MLTSSKSEKVKGSFIASAPGAFIWQNTVYCFVLYIYRPFHSSIWIRHIVHFPFLACCNIAKVCKNVHSFSSRRKRGGGLPCYLPPKNSNHVISNQKNTFFGSSERPSGDDSRISRGSFH